MVLNVPEDLRYIAETVSEKLKRYRAKFKGIEFQECFVLPALEDSES